MTSGDLGRPTFERKVNPLALDLDRLRNAAVEQDVAAGDDRPGLGRIERSSVARESSGQVPAARLCLAIDAEQRPTLPLDCPDRGSHLRGTDERQPIRMGRQIAVQRPDARRHDEP